MRVPRVSPTANAAQLSSHEHVHLEDIPPSTPMTDVKLDWMRRMEGPIYSAGSRFDGIAGIGALAAAAPWRACARPPSPGAGQSSAIVARVPLSGPTAFATGGPSPAGRPSPGRSGVWRRDGVAIALRRLPERVQRRFNRESFVAANEEALDATIHRKSTWRPISHGPSKGSTTPAPGGARLEKYGSITIPRHARLSGHPAATSQRLNAQCRIAGSKPGRRISWGCGQQFSVAFRSWGAR